MQGFDWASNTKPVMYVFNQPWCGACNALKSDFQENGENLKELSNSFVLVNVAGDDNNSFKVTTHC
jgi:thiol-disulfide isomerase/thioredoxin